ncbi:KDP operon transcriptional regulatory protein KdpE [Methylacidimicrobium cyclopophantes]|uniref:KDP operon transcriptional regulatory protein KdpE n=1 Tax=Methylacidimicrobium cyclopophantes TaxID=1041766 RepID=A0A5E6MGG1_9BACT|nr:response regulator [Methylacidimicrobium cyclopophantes]VVM07441.1 KDP operon transcriptional regulatory protein KdpE [Methylacidimicrobium cyclopophantes]
MQPEPTTEHPARLVVIDDEPQIRRLLRMALEGHGYQTVEAASGQEGVLAVAQSRPEAVVLDLLLPDTSGVEVIRRVREWSEVPILVLSALGQEKEKVSALDAGADDYLTKPFGLEELLARIRVMLRRALRPAESPNFSSGLLEIDLSARRVWVNKKELHLTATEYALLRLFARHAGKVLTHRQILQEVWGPKSVEQTHYLRVYIGRLREKLERDPARPLLLLTEPGVGYRLALLDPE